MNDHPEIEDVAMQVARLKHRLNDVVPAVMRALHGTYEDWDLAKQAADINEGGDLRMLIVEMAWSHPVAQAQRFRRDAFLWFFHEGWKR